MSKRTFKYDKATDSMVEVLPDGDPYDGVYVRGDIPSFTSVIDGTLVSGRQQYLEHMRRHNVEPFEQGSENRSVDRGQQEREKRARSEQVWQLVDQHVNRRRR
jgi:hypothetical protein